MTQNNQAMHRRLKHHNYNERGIYMLTFATAERLALLGHLVGEGGDFRIALTVFWERVAAEIQALPVRYPQIKVLDYVIMPDHVHLLLFVREWMPHHLGRIVASLKAKCSQAWWQLQEEDGTLKRTAQNVPFCPVGETSVSPFHRPVVGTSVPPLSSPPRKPSLWEPGYHDRYLMHQGQLQTLHNYIHDNPKQLGIAQIVAQHAPHLPTLVVAAETCACRHADKPVERHTMLHQHIHDPSCEQSAQGSAFKH